MVAGQVEVELEAVEEEEEEEKNEEVVGEPEVVLVKSVLERSSRLPSIFR